MALGLAHGELLRDLERVRLPGDEMRDEIPAGPLMGLVDRHLELLVGQRSQRLVRAPGVALLLEELQGVQVHRRADRIARGGARRGAGR